MSVIFNACFIISKQIILSSTLLSILVLTKSHISLEAVPLAPNHSHLTFRPLYDIDIVDMVLE